MAEATTPVEISATSPTPDAVPVAATAPAAETAVVEAPAADAVTAAPVDADPLAAPSLINADAPAADAEPAAVEGAPEEYDLVAPEGFTLNADAVAEFTPVAKELGLTNEGANKLIPVAAKFAEQVRAQVAQEQQDAIVQTRADWAKAALADPEVGGSPEHHAEVKAVVGKFLDDFGGAEFRAWLDETGLGNHPQLLRTAYRAGQAISEESRVFRVDAAAPAPRSPEQVMYAPEFQPKG